MTADHEPKRCQLPQLGRWAARGDGSSDPAFPELAAARSDPELTAQGWVRRLMAGPDRLQECVEIYESMGFEVKVQPLTVDDFASECRQCAAACDGCVMVYTRRGRSARPE